MTCLRRVLFYTKQHVLCETLSSLTLMLDQQELLFNVLRGLSQATDSNRGTLIDMKDLSGIVDKHVETGVLKGTIPRFSYAFQSKLCAYI